MHKKSLHSIFPNFQHGLNILQVILKVKVWAPFEAEYFSYLLHSRHFKICICVEKYQQESVKGTGNPVLDRAEETPNKIATRGPQKS